MRFTLLLLAAFGCATPKPADTAPAPDPGTPCTAETWFADGDGDGFGDPVVTTTACEAPEGYTDSWTDCDDLDANVHPGAIETCNEIDDDCNDLVDDGAAIAWHDDADSDGYGAPAIIAWACEPPPGAVEDATDCNDTRADVHPDAEDIVQDGVDQDCDGVDPRWCFADADGDGYGDPTTLIAAADGTCDTDDGEAEHPTPADCDDTDPATYPGAEEVIGDGVDQDCDHVDAVWCYPDADGDGFGAGKPVAFDGDGACLDDEVAPNGDDCDDSLATVNPDASERCNLIDDDCDGAIDEDGATDAPSWYGDGDGDGFGTAPAIRACTQPSGTVGNDDDCNDADPAINPSAFEDCDGVDNNCDGVVDTNVTWFPDLDGDGFGGSAGAVVTCAPPSGYLLAGGDCDDADPAIHPDATELCNGVDDDCDGQLDAADPSVADALVAFPDLDEDGAGDAAGATVACALPSGMVLDDRDCDDANAAANPDADERCNLIDDDCDGAIDEDDAIDATLWTVDADGDGWADPAGAIVVACAAPDGFAADPTDCDDADPTVHPYAPEDCADPVDRNCDGVAGGTDADGDGWAGCDGDCDESDPAVNPGAIELCNGLDDDCNALVDDDGAGDFPWRVFADDDGDGFGDPFVWQTDCAGTDPGWVADGADCRDTDPAVNPDALEVCGDGVDNDCDGVALGCLAEFSGIATNIEQDDLVGWAECFVDDFADTSPISSITGACDGELLMLACRQSGSSRLTAAAYAPIVDVMTDTGTSNVLHVANGVGWYFDDSYSWGFAEPTDGVSRNSCDTKSGVYPEQRVCFHTSGGRLSGGYRCGTTTALNASRTWERVFMTATP